MPTANEQIQEATIAHMVDLRAYNESAVAAMLAILQQSDVRLERELRAAMERLSPESFTIQRLQSQLGTVRQTIAAAYERLDGQLSLELQDFAEYETTWQANTFREALPAVINVATVSAPAVYAAAMARPFQGALLSGWLSEQSATAARRVERAVAQGFAESKTTDQIIREIRGTRALRYKDGILEIGRREAAAVVRTALGHTAAVAAEQFETANADLIKSVRWLSTLDLRTTLAYCIPRDGLLYKVGTHEPIGHKFPWGSGPGQIHWNCRSTRTYVTKGWEEFGIASFTPAQRASMDGQVPAELRYPDWLRKQSAARQDEVLGVTKGRLFREDKLSVDEMMTARGRVKTLADLRAAGVSGA